MENKKRSFFERLTGSVRMDDEEEIKKDSVAENKLDKKGDKKNQHIANWIEEENEEAELAIDVYETNTEIVVQTFVAGVKPDDLDLSIARDTLTITGKREESRTIDEDKYFIKELYWGRFARTITLPAEIEPEEVEATEKHGLLTIRMQKVDKDKTNNIKIKSL